MIIEPAAYTYETMPAYTDAVPGARELPHARNEVLVSYTPDVVYGTASGVKLRLQLLLPRIADDPDRRFPCVLFIQGSHWAEQNLYRNVANLGMLARRGYVCTIVEYRPYGIKQFPAQIIDAKNAVRFMRDHAEDYHVDPTSMAIMGDSSGGHVAAIAGMTARTALLDEPASSASCDVRAIIDLYGAVDPTLPYGFPSTLDHQLLTSPEGMLLGCDLRKHPERGLPAVAKTYVEEDFAPMLILHGTKDRTVFCQESVDLYEALRAAGKDVELYLVRGSDHADAGFWSDAALDVYDAFLTRCLTATPSA